MLVQGNLASWKEHWLVTKQTWTISLGLSTVSLFCGGNNEVIFMRPQSLLTQSGTS